MTRIPTDKKGARLCKWAVHCYCLRMQRQSGNGAAARLKARRRGQGAPAPTRPAAQKNGATALHDKQSERDYRELGIDKVGVRNVRFPIQVRDKARAVQNTIATLGMFVELPKEFKGTH